MNHETGEGRTSARPKRKRRVGRWLGLPLLAVLLSALTLYVALPYYRLSQIKKIPIPKDLGVEPSSVSSIALPPELLNSASPVGVDVADSAVIDTVVVDPNDPATGIATPGLGAPEEVPGLPTTKPADSANDAPSDNQQSIPGVPNAKQNKIDPEDLSNEKVLGGPNTKNYLFVGNDDRSVLDDVTGKKMGKGTVTGARTDTIMILRVDPDSQKAWVLSIPRDLWVKVPGQSKSVKINSLFTKDNVAPLISAIREDLNLPVDHLLMVNFAGFSKIVSTLDGVGPICFRKPSRDIFSGLNQPEGCNMLDTTQAMAYVRSRHFQTGENGDWKDDPTSDLGRMKRQQIFLRAVIFRAQKRGLNNPLTLNAMLTDLKGAMVLSDDLGPSKLLKLATTMRSFEPEKLKPFTVPTKTARIGKEDVLLPTDQTAALLSVFGRRPVKNS
jgi:LCP family protein required for cell wall assembly